jgi:hypothetical protein
MSEKLNHEKKRCKLLHTTPKISFEVTGNSTLLNQVYKFASKKLLNAPNVVNPFYLLKSDIFKMVAFSEAILKTKMCWLTLVRSKL